MVKMVPPRPFYYTECSSACQIEDQPKRVSLHKSGTIGGMSSFLSSDQPVCVAIVICNEIIEDKRTSNKTLVSLFNSIGVPSLPATHPRLFLMASLTNLREELPVSFSIKSHSGREILRINGAATSGGDPLGVIDLIVEVLGLSIQEEGVHFVDVLSGDRLLGSRRFTVQKMGG
jgi:hypothetical protein